MAEFPVVSLTRYSASSFSHGGTYLEWRKGERGWSAEKSLHTVDRSLVDCNSLLEVQQLYSLKKMTERGYLNEQQLKFYSSLGLAMIPEQISFFELKSKDKVLATMWSVSSQSERNPENAKILLPWMLEEKWKNEALRVAGTGLKYFWEWGRAAQESAKDIDELVQFAVMSSYRELRALQGDIHEAAVFIHAITPAHTLAYMRKFGKEIVFSKGDPTREDAILLIPLSRLMEQYPLRNVSSVVNRLRIASGQEWPDGTYADLIDLFRTTLWSELTYRGIRSISAQPIVVQNFSLWGLNSIHSQLVHAGLSESRSKTMMEILLEQPYSKKISGLFHYIDVVEPKGVSSWSWDESAIEVSGLDPTQLSDDPDYLHRILFAVASIAISQVREVVGMNTPIKDIWFHLLQRKTKIVVVTRDEKMAEKIRELKPIEEKSWVTLPANDVPKMMRDRLGDDWGTTSKWLAFDFGRLLAMTLERPDLDAVFEESRGRLFMGKFWTRQKLADHDLY